MNTLAGESLKKPGLPSGAAPHAGRVNGGIPRVSFIAFNENSFRENLDASLDECLAPSAPGTVRWINVDGVRDQELIGRIGAAMELHPLIIEDIANTSQRPKMDDFERYLFIVLKMLMMEEHGGGIKSEQVSLVLAEDIVVSFQERPGDVFEPVRERIRKNRGRVRKMGADYLLYCLMDAVAEHYFTIVERIGEQIESVEQSLVARPTRETLRRIHKLKMETVIVRKSVWPLRELVAGLERVESELIRKATRPFLRWLYGNTIQVMEAVETFRDMLSGMVEIYLSSMSNRLNEVMKVLTIISTIFIPLTFIAGVYGMNFRNMPELEWRFGYFGVLAVMAAVALGMVVYFKRKKWIWS